MFRHFSFKLLDLVRKFERKIIEFLIHFIFVSFIL